MAGAQAVDAAVGKASSLAIACSAMWVGPLLPLAYRGRARTDLPCEGTCCRSSHYTVTSGANWRVAPNHSVASGACSGRWLMRARAPFDPAGLAEELSRGRQARQDQRAAESGVDVMWFLHVGIRRQ